MFAVRGFRAAVLASMVILYGSYFCKACGQDEFRPSIDFKGSRFAAGYADSGNKGPFPDGSIQMPDAKLRFNWAVAPDVRIVSRLNLNNATFNSVDFLYLEYANILPAVSISFKDSFFNPAVRLGRFKLDVGEETFGNNPVEGALVFNSAGIVSGDDEALMIFQSLPAEKTGIPLKWSLTMSNGNKGSGADNEQAKALGFKMGANPVNSLYMSATYYSSGDLGNSNAEISYAGLAAPPANMTEWDRTIMEFDVRYDISPGKEKRLEPSPPAYSDSMAFFRFGYGLFRDDGSDKAVPVASVTDREGKHFFIEGTYNPVPKIYLAARYSFAGFDDGSVFDSLNGVVANSYTRLSFGIGYRLADNVHVKTEFTSNSEDMPVGAEEPENNQLSMLFTVKF